MTERKRPGLATGLAQGGSHDSMTDRERALCDYAVKLTRTPWEMRESDLQPMRDAGLSDRDVLDAALITCYFAYVNRLADGLGIELEGDDDMLGW